jgi:hypothetical protein
MHFRSLIAACLAFIALATGALAQRTSPVFNNLTVNGALTWTGCPAGVAVFNGAGAAGCKTPSQLLDTFGATQGSVLYRGAAGWAALPPGSSGQALTSGGAGANPGWSTVPGWSIWQNLLPNTQWQTASAVCGLCGGSLVVETNREGTAIISPSISVTAFTTNSATPTFYTANTDQLKVGDIVIVQGAGGCQGIMGYSPLRIQSLTPNVSFTAQVPLQSNSPGTSCALTVTPITIGNYDGTGIYGPDGWMKTNSLNMWRDTFAVNRRPGSFYTMGFRKGSASVEHFYSSVPADLIPRYQGRTIVFGSPVLSRANVGTGAYQLCIITDTTNTCTAATNGMNAYAWSEIAAAIPETATSIRFDYALKGSLGDIYYVSQPMAAFGSTLGAGAYVQPKNEHIKFLNHVNAPSMTPMTLTYPTSAWPGTSVYGWEFDIEAITFGQIGRTVASVDTQMEFTTPTVGLNIEQSSCLCAPGTIFGMELWTQVANKVVAGNGQWTIDNTGLYLSGQPGWFALSGGMSGGTISNLTVDFSGATLN